MLPAICDAWNLDHGACEPLHKAFKEAFDVESTAFFDDNDFYSFIDSIHGLLVVEYGTWIPHVNEEPGMDEMTMRQYLRICRANDRAEQQ